MENRLADEKSPYLLQHAENPVDWYPWGEEAFNRARDEEKPIFLSIGYSTCHWCHVMERESFENEEIAHYLNDHFVAIKVDREERPDVDQIYMNGLQSIGGNGGWPLNVFLTPDRKMFWGGTYFPPEQKYQRPGFLQVLENIHQSWLTKREAIETDAERLREFIGRNMNRVSEGGPKVPAEEVISQACKQWELSFDKRWGGFGSAPKFPRCMSLQVLLRAQHDGHHDSGHEIVGKTLDRMWEGGIYDHLGGGFSRYSVDEKWLIPHFEKMLYDNALLVMTYIEAYQATGNSHYLDVAKDVLRYVARDMTHPDGGFYSAEDADSEGEEGKFYSWTPDQIRDVLGDYADLFCAFYGVTDEGNFEHGTSALHRPMTVDVFHKKYKGEIPDDLEAFLSTCRSQLFDVREKRIRPGLDDKILTAWNGLMISALARAHMASGEIEYLDLATRSAEFLFKELRPGSDRMAASWRNGKCENLGFLDDQAFYIQALLDLVEATGDTKWLAWAVQVQQEQDTYFGAEDGGYYFAPSDRMDDLVVRSRDPYDGAIPSGNAVSILNLFRLNDLTGHAHYRELAERALALFGPMIEEHPTAYPQMLVALQHLLNGSQQFVITGPSSSSLAPFLEVLQTRYCPYAAKLLVDTSDPEAWVGNEVVKGKGKGEAPAVWVCEQFACQAPVLEPDEFRAILDRTGR